MKHSEIDYWIANMLARPGVSDLNMTVGKPLQVESSGVLTPVAVEPEVEKITPFQAEVFALNIIGGNKRLLHDLARNGSCDLAYSLSDKAHFRVNIFSQRGNLSTVLRILPTEIPTVAGLHLPPVFSEIPRELNGFILVTGSTGSGKSTTLAALLNQINVERPVHVVTLEDPIEFVHPQLKATFNQRELGNDFDSFPNGLRAALRQAPKVILVGEIRDRETMEIALTAAETGHLLMSTLHTVDAGQAVNRCLGMFERAAQEQIRNRLVDTMRWIVGQRLLPKLGGGRVAAFEVMRRNLRVSDAILNGESEGKTFYDIIADGHALGMQTFDQHILQIYQAGYIDDKAALGYCSRRSAVARGLDQIKAAKGESTTGITGLSMDSGEEDPYANFR
ncbi:MAG: PilT/PilU family type 4a pilus ATPase [Deltaproteobacteria bacterium]|nr:PilT/PilU family type 4a pilus ATPase [Deltaproteobacteria bacterium]